MFGYLDALGGGGNFEELPTYGSYSKLKTVFESDSVTIGDIHAYQAGQCNGKRYFIPKLEVENLLNGFDMNESNSMAKFAVECTA